MQSHGVIDLRKKKAGAAKPRPLSSPLPFSDGGDKRPLPLRVRRRRTRILIVLAALALVAVLAFAISWLSYLPQISIGTISVTGAQQIPPRIVADYVETILDDGLYHFLSRRNILLYPKALIEKNVALEFPRIQSVKAARTSLLATTLTVFIEERQPYALWCPASPAELSASTTTTTCYEMDSSGSLFAPQDTASSSSRATQYIFNGGINAASNPIGQTFVAGRLPHLTALLDLLGQSGYAAHGASVEDNQDFSIPLDAGYILKASFGQDTSMLMRNLELVLSSSALKEKEDQLEYIDLRFGNRVYYKLKGQDQTTTQ